MYLSSRVCGPLQIVSASHESELQALRDEIHNLVAANTVSAQTVAVLRFKWAAAHHQLEMRTQARDTAKAEASKLRQDLQTLTKSHEELHGRVKQMEQCKIVLEQGHAAQQQELDTLQQVARTQLEATTQALAAKDAEIHSLRADFDQYRVMQVLFFLSNTAIILHLSLFLLSINWHYIVTMVRYVLKWCLQESDHAAANVSSLSSDSNETLRGQLRKIATESSALAGTLKSAYTAKQSECVTLFSSFFLLGHFVKLT